MLTLGSLFDGMAGFPLAFAQAGVVTRWVVELEEDCRRVSGKHFPEAAAFADVRDVGAHNLEPVDVITGGFPCQDLSVAGVRAGLAGARSGLFFEIVRIVREMREATANEYPKYVVLENVPGLLSSHRGRDFAVVLGELADLGAVDIGWRVCDAQFWGVAQRRRRVFIVVCFGAERAAEILSLTEGSSGHPPSRREARQDAARGAAVGAAFGGNNTSGAIDVACGLNAKGGSGRSDFETETFVAERLPEVAHSLRAQAQLAHRADVDTLIPTVFQQNQRDEVRDLGDVAGALAAEKGTHQQNYIAFTPRDVASALTSNYGKQPDNSDTALGPNLAVQAMAVRRLTPLECLRLQGYPDTYLDDLNLSDSAKYRMCGNSVAVPVVAWLARRLAGC